MRSTCWILLLGLIGAVPAMARAAQEPPVAPAANEPDRTPAVDSTRLFVLPTARTLEPGRGYVVGHGLVVPSFQVGVTRHFSVGAGTFFGYASWITPKVQIYNGRRNSAAVAALHFVVPGEGSLGLAYVAASHGTSHGEWTIGAGQVYSSIDRDWHWARGGPLIVIGGERRLTPRVTLITENYGGLERTRGRLRPSVGLLMAGMRVERRRFVFDVGAVASAHRDLFFVFPIFNWAVRF